MENKNKKDIECNVYVICNNKIRGRELGKR